MHTQRRIVIWTAAGAATLWLVEALALSRYVDQMTFLEALWPAHAEALLTGRLGLVGFVLIVGMIMAIWAAREEHIKLRLATCEHSQQTLTDLDSALREADSMQALADAACHVLCDSADLREAWIMLWRDTTLSVAAHAAGLGHKLILNASLLARKDGEIAQQVLARSGAVQLREGLVSERKSAETLPAACQALGHRLEGISGMSGLLVGIPAGDATGDERARAHLHQLASIIGLHLKALRAQERLVQGTLALEKQKGAVDAQARVARCLGEISQLEAHDPTLTLQEVVRLLPMAYKDHQLVAASIAYRDQVFQSGVPSPSSRVVSVPIQIEGEALGSVSVWPVFTEHDSEFDQTLVFSERFLASVVQRIVAMLAQHAALERMDQLSQYHEAILQSATICGIVVDTMGRVRHWNKAAENLTGLAADQVRGSRKFWSNLLADRRSFAQFLRHLRPQMAHRQVILGQRINIHDRVGQVRTVSTDIVPLTSQLGQLQGYLVLARDITAELISQQALLAERNRLRNVLDAMPDLVYIKDRDLRYIAVNRATCAFLGNQPEQNLIGKTFYQVFPIPAAYACMETEGRVVATGQAECDATLRIKDAQGQQREYLVSNVPLRAQDGSVVGLVGVCHDMTEYRQMERQLLDAHKMEAVGQLAGGAAHDFNNLLTVISLQSELLLAMHGEDELLSQCIEEIMGATERASQLTQQLLAFGRRQILDIGPMSVNDSISRLYEMYRRVVAENILLDLDLLPDLEPAMTDDTQVAQLLTNLVLNASEAMPHGGVLTIKTAQVELQAAKAVSNGVLPAGRYALLGVSDTGVGIPPELQKHIFEPFFTTKAIGQGSGMGLATTFGIVSQLEGGIEFETAIGKGTEFRVYLPLAQEATVPIAIEERADLIHGSERVLVVEDERHLRLLAAQILDRLGYDVLQADCGPEAIALLAGLDKLPDMILSDVVMPEMSGPEMMARLREDGIACPVLYMTGYSDDLVDRRGGLEPGERLLHKPFKMHDLAASVRQTLDSADGSSS